MERVLRLDNFLNFCSMCRSLFCQLSADMITEVKIGIQHRQSTIPQTAQALRFVLINKRSDDVNTSIKLFER